MKIKATLKYLRMAPRKVRLVANLIKGLSVDEAENQLKFLTKRAAVPILKLLKSAVANAVHNFNLDKSNLYIFRISVDNGSMLKRWLPRAMGRATPIQKKNSHITLILEDKPRIKKEIKSQRPEVEKIKETTFQSNIEAAQNNEAKPVAKTFKPSVIKKDKSRMTKKVLSFGRKIFRRKNV